CNEKRKRLWPAFRPAHGRTVRCSAPKLYARPKAKENPPRSSRSLPSALTISFRLVRIDLAHALQQFFNVGFIHFRRAGAIASASGRWTGGTCFLGLIRHKSSFQRGTF